MTDTAAVYNPFEPGFVEDPYPSYAALREQDPVHQSAMGTWFLFRYDDVVRFTRDTAMSVEDENAHPTMMSEMFEQLMADQPAAQRGSRAMLNLDPPDHTRLRRLVSKAFTPRVIEELRPMIQGVVDSALDKAAANGGMELIGDLAFPLPFQVITHMMGMPDTDTEQLREWSGLLVRSLEPILDPELLKQIASAAESMQGLIGDAITWKRTQPADDLLSALIAAEEEGDKLSDEELMAQVMLLYIAGHETTVNLIGNGSLALARNPEQYQRLRDDPSLIGNAIEELLRYDPPVQMTRRVTLAEVEVGGKTIEQGAFAALSLASANRDEAKWGPNAAEVDLGREGANQQLSFGGGHHYCLGAALARLEAQVAIGSLAARFSSLELAGEPVYNGRINLRGLDRLPVTVKVGG
jgi:cytochrome P450